MSDRYWEELADDLEEQIATLKAELERVRQERRDALNVKSKDGLLSSEWILRTGKAERERDEAKAELAKRTNERDTLADLNDVYAAELAKRDEVIQRFVSFITEQVDVEELPAVLDDARAILSRADSGEVLAVVDTEIRERNDLPYNVDGSGLWLTCRVPGKYPCPVRVTVRRRKEGEQ